MNWLTSPNVSHNGCLYTLLQDFAYGLRRTLTNPGLSLVVVVTLALGIGINTAIFSVIYAVLVRPLPYPAEDQLIQIRSWSARWGYDAVSFLDFSEIRRQTNVFQQIASSACFSRNLDEPGEPTRVQVCEVTPGLLPLLGGHPDKGRWFVDQDMQSGLNEVAVISESLWVDRFGSDPHVAGHSIHLNGKLYMIVGVLPSDFVMPSDIEYHVTSSIWIPMALPKNPRNYAARMCFVLGRLRKGVSVNEARTELHTVASRLAQEFPAVDRGLDLRAARLHELIVEDARPTLFVLCIAVSLVLLMACMNVANLLLARGLTRQKEIAIRKSLGASRGRIVKQLLTEGLIPSLIGGLLGLLGAFWGVRLLVAVAPADTPRINDVHINIHVVAFALVISICAGVLANLYPAFRLSEVNLHEALKDSNARGGARLVSDTRCSRLNVLVISQTALASVLLVGAGLMIRSFWKLITVDCGLNMENMLVVKVNPTSAGVFQTKKGAVEYFQNTLDQIKGLPGVKGACITSVPPLAGQVGGALFNSVEGHMAPPHGQRPFAQVRAVSPGYFRTIGQRFLAGHDFEEQDDQASPGVVIINEAFAHRFFQGESPVGKHILAGWGENKLTWEVVGVVSNARDVDISRDSQPEVFLTYKQLPYTQMFFLVRTDGAPLQMASVVRAQLLGSDVGKPILDISTQDQLISRLEATPQYHLILLGGFAALALLIALLGIYGTVSYTVARRTREIGIRMVMGATPGSILRLILLQGMTAATSGILLGLALAFFLARFLSSMIFQIKPQDPMTFVGVAILFTLSALASHYIPVRRAMHIDPVAAVREE